MRGARRDEYSAHGSLLRRDQYPYRIGIGSYLGPFRKQECRRMADTPGYADGPASFTIVRKARSYSFTTVGSSNSRWFFLRILALILSR